MIFRAYSILFRRRLLAATFIALLAPALFVYIAANLCGCGNDSVASNLKLFLASFSIVSLLLGIIFGVGAAIHAPGVPNQQRFLLTRPIPILAMQFYPLAIATGGIVVLPALGWMAVLGALGLAHAPMLQRLATVMATYPHIPRMARKDPGIGHNLPREIANLSCGGLEHNGTLFADRHLRRSDAGGTKACREIHLLRRGGRSYASDGSGACLLFRFICISSADSIFCGSRIASIPQLVRTHRRADIQPDSRCNGTDGASCAAGRAGLKSPGLALIGNHRDALDSLQRI